MGGLGGRVIASWRWRARIAELWEAVDGIDRRLSKREGRAGAEVKAERQAARDPAALQLLGKMLGRGGGDGPLDPVEMDARAARHFRAKDKAGSE